MFHAPFDILLCINPYRAEAFVCGGNDDVGVLFYFFQKF